MPGGDSAFVAFDIVDSNMGNPSYTTRITSAEGDVSITVSQAGAAVRQQRHAARLPLRSTDAR